MKTRLPSPSVSSVVSQLAAGGAALLCDDPEDAERGVIIYSAALATTATTAFTVRHSSGYLVVALPATRCAELGIPALNLSRNAAERFCVAVDSASGVTTGISAADRATTCRALGDPASDGRDFVRPGHVVVLASEEVEPLTFSAAALRLMESAGQWPLAVVIADLVSPRDPTAMATGTEPVDFASQHGLPWVSLSDL